MQHASRLGRMTYRPDNLLKAQESRKKPVVAIKDGKRILFSSQAEAANALGINRAHIAEACRKEYGYNKIGGYEWEYQDSEYQKSLKPKRNKMTPEERRDWHRKRMLGNKLMLGKALSDNTKEKLRTKSTKAVLQFSKDGKFIREYFSAQEAKRVTGILHIPCCCRKERKTAGGYIWRYKNE